ncbi:MAG: hypothetical protein RBT49_02405 [Bacteroidales bacterium]|jgi:hypothetical protein|nr:hypothetical protein [Bacteroidales bacterium]
MLSVECQIMIASGICFVLDSHSPMLMNTMLNVLEKHWSEFESPIKQNILNELKDYLKKNVNDSLSNFVSRKAF